MTINLYDGNGLTLWATHSQNKSHICKQQQQQKLIRKL